MTPYKTINPRLRRYGKEDKLRVILTCFLMMIVVTSAIYFLFDSYFTTNVNEGEIPNEFFQDNEPLFAIEPSAGIEIFQDPFTVHFEDMLQFFNAKYKTDLNLDINTYFREGDSSGIISDDSVYPVDTMLLYNTLLKNDLTSEQVFSNYLTLKDSLFWYDKGGFNYGFITSVDNSTKQINDDRRSLVDNLMVISLLIENIGDEINTINQDGIYPEDSIEEIFNLINSSQFWDSTNKGFTQYNTTDFSENKDIKSNFHAILANLKIRNIYEKLGLNSDIKDKAYLMANETMDSILLNMWDDTNKGFYPEGGNDWDPEDGNKYKYLDVNALGIITLIEYWLETGLKDATLLDKAITVFEKIETNLLVNDSYYYFNKGIEWDVSGQDLTIDLEANSLMMLACLKLFEVTGNFTYYERAYKIHSAFESKFYDINAYYKTLNPVDDNKNLNSNLKLVKSYSKALEIFTNTVLQATYNVTEEIPNYIFKQEILNIKSRYFVNNSIEYFNYSSQSYQIIRPIYNITSADITYLFKYSNGTLFDTKLQAITGNLVTLEYEINETLSIGNGYSLYIYSNSSYFGTAQILKRFNVISGLVSSPILGLPATLYQGPIYNITLPVNNTRNQDINLTVKMEGENINGESKLVEFPTSILTNISFNLEAKLGASIGLQNITFTFKSGNIVYLKLIKTINLGYSIDYKDFLYQNRVVSGDSFQVFFNLVNFLPNNTQSCNISFSGEFIQNLRQEITLEENELRSLYYDLTTHENIVQTSIAVRFEISKGKTTLYSRTIEITIIPVLEIISVSFPEIVSQGDKATFIMIIQNNREISIPYSLTVISVNGEQIKTGGLAPGENRIQIEVLPTLFPYDFFEKTYIFQLKDDSESLIAQYYYTVSIIISPANIILFYVLPIGVAVGIILFYKNKELKHKQLRR